VGKGRHGEMEEGRGSGREWGGKGKSMEVQDMGMHKK